MAYKFNPLTGNLDYYEASTSGAQNFSIKYVTSSQSISIPVNQEMSIYKFITIDGTLDVVGDLVIYE